MQMTLPVVDMVELHEAILVSMAVRLATATLLLWEQLKRQFLVT